MNAWLAPATPTYADDEARWAAVVARDPSARGAFVYSVRTTGVYCRADCPSRLARRENVRFHATIEEAERAGFRACLRCRPTEDPLADADAEVVARACRLLETSDRIPSLTELASSVGLSPHHFHRVFKAQTGVTPRSYASTLRARRLRDQLERRPTITEAFHAAGFESSGRFYEASNDLLGMTPTEFRQGGPGSIIRFAIGESTLGSILVAASDRGVCAILLGEDPGALARDLEDRFPQAELIGGDAEFERLVAEVVAFVEAPNLGWSLPLDIRGTAFQQRVWEALRSIPPGSTASYAEVAGRVGRPRAVRAVAQACAANALAVAIPCHRVVRSDGGLSGYRWGVERKAELLRRERDEP
jgi:AraC family transcriptional regulator of adaptative response/methylated-DNA-[protein]-cysteine methyltransferase